MQSTQRARAEKRSLDTQQEARTVMFHLERLDPAFYEEIAATVDQWHGNTRLGFGVFRIADPAECERSVRDAIDVS